MIGSDKQVTWARDIQAKIIATIDALMGGEFAAHPLYGRTPEIVSAALDQLAALRELVASCPNAKILIDSRALSHPSNMTEIAYQRAMCARNSEYDLQMAFTFGPSDPMIARVPQALRPRGSK